MFDIAFVILSKFVQECLLLHPWLKEFKSITKEHSTLFFAKDYDWYPEDGDKIVELYNWLDDLDVNDFKLIVLDQDDPEDDIDDRGVMYDSFALRREVTVKIKYNE